MPKCIVSGCSNHTANKEKNLLNGIMLHTFPKNLLRIKCWLSQIYQDFEDIESFAKKILEGKKTDNFRICSEHFSPDSYRRTKRKKVLKDNAIPHHFHKNPQSCNTAASSSATNPFFGVRQEHVQGSPRQFSPFPRMTSMDKGSIYLTDRILSLTLEILFLLTGEDYTVAKKACAERITTSSSPTESGGRIAAKETDPMTTTDFVSHEKNREILQLTNQIIHLLTGEVPARCEDVAVYFSIEEWDYVDKHKHLYKKVIMDDHQQNLYKKVIMDDHQQNLYKKVIMDDHQQNLYKKVIMDDHQQNLYKKVILDDHQQNLYKKVIMDDHQLSSQGDERLSTPEHEIEIEIEDDLIEEPLQDFSQSGVNSPPGGDYVSSDLSNPEPMSADSTDRRDAAQMPLSCSECGKCFKFRSRLISHKRIHTGEKLFSCPECGKSFMWKSLLIQHKKIHTGEHQCLVCGRCFTNESKLIDHQRTHTGERPFTCHQCGKSFGLKTWLTKHKRLHTE
ncbi:zinc finger protein 679-like [Bufo gargarizans]|uniref:zinc finger protein 679-like n=1 Tax=Bufo gargarizans TaxID=30331 RepID=UPI001CF27267|nr:zinc finger protein 679-like [Bufo gargarizans]XP_044149883.1 zinc finger protein 679-like [Bufo gargarizans]